MNATLGTAFGVLAALFGTACAAAVFIPGVGRRTSRLLLNACASAGVASAGMLAWALVTSDFTIAYVVDYSRRGASAPIRFAGLWGGIEGSLLLWGVMSAAIGAVASSRLVDESERVAVLVRGVLGGVAAATIAISLLFTNPFTTLKIPAISGGGLTPILEHPAMTFHPPLLYLGVLSFTPPFALALARLLTRSFDVAAVQRVVRWTVLALGLTTIGLLAGANWAYVELGWGGYWAWDPVENAAFLPWLVGLAFVHAARRLPAGTAATADRSVPRHVAALSIAPFLVMSASASVVRSGVTTSVHSFAEELSVGWAMGAVTATLAIIAGLALARNGHRETETQAPGTAVPSTDAGLIGRHGLRLAAVLIIVLAATVAIGSFAPLFMAKGSVVSGHFYAPVAGPLAGVAVILAGLAPLAGRASVRRLGLAVLGAAFGMGVAYGVGWPLGRAGLLIAASCAGLAAALPTLRDLFRRSPGAAIAHIGFALFVIGIAGSTAGADVTAPLLQGASLTVDDLTITNNGVRVVDGPVPDTTAVVADIRIDRNGEFLGVLKPELVSYASRGRLLAETATRSTIGGDVQIALERASNDQTVIIDIHTRPLIGLVWLGPLTMAAGFLMAARRRRDRHGVEATDTVATWIRPETAISPSTGADQSPPHLPIPS